MTTKTLSFMRRRPPHPTRVPSHETNKVSLTLTNSAVEEKSQQATSSLAPFADDTPRLDSRIPMVRFNRFQSSIGSLRLRFASYAGREVLWELEDGQMGMLNNVPLDSGNRAYIDTDKDGAGFVIGMRHVSEMRRMVFAFSTDASLSMQSTFGKTLSIAPECRILEIYVFNGELYVRYDETVYDSTQALRQTYGL